jgi:hypothetical protein
MRTATKLGAAAPVAFTALALTGCGGSSGAGSSPGSGAAAGSAANIAAVSADGGSYGRDGSVGVTHGTEMEVPVCWPQDDLGHVLSVSGTTAAQYRAGLPRIIRSEAP